MFLSTTDIISKQKIYTAVHLLILNSDLFLNCTKIIFFFLKTAFPPEDLVDLLHVYQPIFW